MGRFGENQKGQEIIDGFNRKKVGRSVGSAKLRKLKREAEAAKLTAAVRLQAEISELDRFRPLSPVVKTEVVEESAEAAEPGSSPAPVPATELVPEPVVDDIGFSSKMWNDLRAAYMSVSGKKKLAEMMKDDRNFQLLFKELMKMEAVQLAAKMKRQEEGNNAGFFVILKGLEDDATTIARLKAEREAKKGAIDLKQVGHILDPEAGKYEEVEEEQVKEKQLEGPASW